MSCTQLISVASRCIVALTAALALTAATRAQTPPAEPTPQSSQAPVDARPAYDTHQPPPPAVTVPTPTPGIAPVVAPQPTQQKPFVARNAYDPQPAFDRHDYLGSTYIPVDSWMYPALLRLYSMGYLDTAFISMRPWTRRSVQHMLDETAHDISSGNNDEAKDILDKLFYALRDEPATDSLLKRGLVSGLASAYVGVRVVHGQVLRNSYYLGTTFNNDYGRPYSNGFNTYNGFSTISEFGPFSLYVRAEQQHSPSFQGYTTAQATYLSVQDQIPYSGPNRPQSTIPEGLLPAQNHLRILEASLSAHIIGHEISFGKSDAWLGPGLGGSMAWSNNAENMYAFRINRVEPLHIPLLSRLVGPVRYDFFIGSLQGHTQPNAPYAHSEKLDFAPTKNFQIGAQRTIIFGGKEHAPVTIHTFLKGFFDFNDTTDAEKKSREDPGARFSTITFSYRLPFLRNTATLYADSTTHDDIFPVSAPRRAGWRPGLYLSHLPGVHKLDLRMEGTYTDFPTSRSNAGDGHYFEIIQRQGYTNKGFIMGDWIGREAKGGQAWLTYHLSGNEQITLQFLRKRTPNDFIPGGVSQTMFRVDAVKRFGRDVELNAWLQTERFKAPFTATGQQGSTTAAFTLTWYPRLKSNRLY